MLLPEFHCGEEKKGGVRVKKVDRAEIERAGEMRWGADCA